MKKKEFGKMESAVRDFVFNIGPRGWASRERESHKIPQGFHRAPRAPKAIDKHEKERIRKKWRALFVISYSTLDQEAGLLAKENRTKSLKAFIERRGPRKQLINMKTRESGKMESAVRDFAFNLGPRGGAHFERESHKIPQGFHRAPRVPKEKEQ